MGKGQSLVELAISLVFIMFLLAGVVELSLSLFQFIQLRDAAQEGALYGSICQNESSIESRARQESASPLNLSTNNVQLFIDFYDSEGIVHKSFDSVQVGDSIQVTLSYNHKVFMPFFNRVIIPLNAHVTDTILQINQSC